MDLEVTDDEEFITQIKEIADGTVDLDAPKQFRAFDPYDSYYSEED